MGDIQQPDLQSLIKALSAGDQRGHIASAGLDGFNTGVANEREARKQALKEKMDKAGLLGGKQANTALPGMGLEEDRDYSPDLLNALRQTRPEAAKATNPLDEELKRAQIGLTNARTKAAGQTGAKTAARGIEAKNKATLYVGQAIPANELLNQMSGKFTGRMDRIEGVGPLQVPERFKSGGRKSFEGAARRFASAVLRPETGAQANEQEIIDTQKRFIEQPGDTPDVIEEKRASRQTFINLLKAIAEGDQEAGLKLDELIATPSTLARAAKVKAERQTGASLEPTGGEDLSAMSDEELERIANGQ